MPGPGRTPLESIWLCLRGLESCSLPSSVSLTPECGIQISLCTVITEGHCSRQHRKKGKETTSLVAVDLRGPFAQQHKPLLEDEKEVWVSPLRYA